MPHSYSDFCGWEPSLQLTQSSRHLFFSFLPPTYYFCLYSVPQCPDLLWGNHLPLALALGIDPILNSRGELRLASASQRVLCPGMWYSLSKGFPRHRGGAWGGAFSFSHPGAGVGKDLSFSWMVSSEAVRLELVYPFWLPQRGHLEGDAGMQKTERIKAGSLMMWLSGRNHKRSQNHFWILQLCKPITLFYFRPVSS